MDGMKGGRVLVVRVASTRGLHSTRPRTACRGTKDRTGSSGASLDDSWCKPGGIKCKKMWYDKEVEMSNTGSWVSCHSRPAGFTNLCGEICPPRRVLLRRTKNDLQICSWDCETMQLPPCYTFERTWCHKLKCIVSKIPRFLFILLLIVISYKAEIWTVPDPNLKFIVEVRTAFNEHNKEIIDAAAIKRKVVRGWNTLIAYLFTPFAWLVGASNWTGQEELVYDLQQMCVKEIDEHTCDFECMEELCEHEVIYDPEAEALKWPVYRDLENWRWSQEMNELQYDKIPTPTTSPYAYKFMPDINIAEKCKEYEKEEYALAENWMPPVGSIPLTDDRKCYMNTVEALRLKIRRRRLAKLKGVCPEEGCRLSLYRERCMYQIEGCRCPAFIKRPPPPVVIEEKLSKCIKPESNTKKKQKKDK